MTLRTAPRKVINRITQQEQLNFLLTNRIPRRYATILIGWLSKRENVIVRTILLTLWRIFSDLDLSEAKPPDREARGRVVQRRLARSLALRLEWLDERGHVAAHVA